MVLGLYQIFYICEVCKNDMLGVELWYNIRHYKEDLKGEKWRIN